MRREKLAKLGTATIQNISQSVEKMEGGKRQGTGGLERGGGHSAAAW